MEESQIAMEHEAQRNPENISIQDGGCDATSFTQNNVVTQQPAKKPTRQWAAWTRQEEESFFAALRQVGKNFEKITSRVQSKNKDQVRHYYYRLVRRMNKLLGPEFCLDAKNSKDTNAAMLRWWSLLEKYSCKASKLHLKPRRYKLFIEALESQLLKDRKKSMRKRLSLGEYCSPMDPCATSLNNRASGPENRGVKLVLVDSQNVQKLGPGKGSLKRNVNVGLNRNTTRGDSVTMKPPRQQRNSGVGTSSTYKKWEKAAIAGVSLVADAAEHLERTATRKNVHDGQSALGQRNFNPTGEDPSYSPGRLQNEYNNQTSAKLKLQLFPIDDSTRKALENDKHNPHLELTLSSRKRISSVVEHLSRKWGETSIACGGLMLFPFGAQRENLVGYQRWSQESVVTAADVYAMIGCPPVFRLRYGWFSNDELGSGAWQFSRASCCLSTVRNGDMDQSNKHISDSGPTSVPSFNERSGSFRDHFINQPVSVCQGNCLPSNSVNQPTEMSMPDTAASNKGFVEPPDPPASSLWNKKARNDQSASRQFEDLGEQKLHHSTALLAGEWADSLTNVSVGDLLAEDPQDANANCFSQPPIESFQCFQQIPFSCDSFDAAIAAHISRQQDKSGLQSCFLSHSSTIWDAEETCDAFSFQKNCASKEISSFSGAASSGASKKDNRTSSTCFVGFSEVKLPERKGSEDRRVDADPMDECPSNEQIVDDPGNPMGDRLFDEDIVDNPGNPMDEYSSGQHIFDHSEKEFNSLADISWPDSLGPLDLEIPSSKYHSQDLILSDSLDGLNHLIASSLDAFQNCSFFGSDKKEPAPTLESWGSASFSDLKIGSEG